MLLAALFDIMHMYIAELYSNHHWNIKKAFSELCAAE